MEHACHIGDIDGIDAVEVHARAVFEASEQIRAVAGETDLVGGSDACDRQWSDLAALFVVLVELATDECHLAGGAVEGVIPGGNFNFLVKQQVSIDWVIGI